MSEIFNNLKKADAGSPLTNAADTSGVKVLGIDDMKRQILEKLREKKERTAAIVEDAKPAIGREEMLRVINKPVDIARPVERVVITKDVELAKQCEKLRAELVRKEAAIQSLEKRLKEEKDGAAASLSTLKAKDEKISGVNDLLRELSQARKLNEEQRARHEDLQTEHKKVSLGRDETAKLLKILRSETDEKEKIIQGLQKKVLKLDELEASLRAGKDTDELERKYALGQDLQKRLTAEIDELTKERDRVASNVESLRSKLYAATKEMKEQIAKITQLEEVSRSKDRKILETDKSIAILDAAKRETETKLRAAEEENKNLNESQTRLNDELAGVKARMEQAEKSCRELNASHGDTSSQLQAALRGKKELEARFGQMQLELEAKTTRLAEVDTLHKNLDLNEDSG